MLYLQWRREELGWPQAQLARETGSHQPTISKIERGLISPSDDLLNKIAGVLGVAPAFCLLRSVAVREEVVFSDSDRQVSA